MKRNQISTIISRKGAGKSVLMQYLLLKNNKSCVVFDPTHSLPPFKNRIFFDYEKHGVRGFRRLINYIGARIYRQKIDIVITNCNEPEEILDIVYYNLYGLCIVMDEVDLAYKPMLSQDSTLYKILNFGRHKELDFIGVCRRPANCPRALTSQSDYLYLGIHNKEPRDSSYLKEFINTKALNAYETLNLYDFLKIDLTKQKSEVFRLPKYALKLLKIS